MLLIDTGSSPPLPIATTPSPRLRNRSYLAVTASVIPEAAWLIETRLGPAAKERFLTLVAGSRFTIVDRTPPTTDHRHAQPCSVEECPSFRIRLYYNRTDG